MKSDRKFNTDETIRSSGIAADWSGNERAVCLCKMFNFLKTHREMIEKKGIK